MATKAGGKGGKGGRGGGTWGQTSKKAAYSIHHAQAKRRGFPDRSIPIPRTRSILHDQRSTRRKYHPFPHWQSVEVEPDYEMTTILVNEAGYSKARSVFDAAANEGFDCRGVEPETDALVAAIRETNAKFAIIATPRFGPELYEAMPKGGVLARFGVGIDGVDLPTATAKGILVTNTPGVLSEAVAEHTMFLMMSAINVLPYRAGTGANFNWGPMRSGELRNKTLVILGCGAIGKLTARMAHAMQMNVVGVELADTDEQEMASYGFTRIVKQFEEVAESADFISVHIPSVPATRHFINAERLKMLKPTAWVVNTARGPVIDESALYDAAAAGEIGGAALDVFESEPYEPVADGKDLRTLSNIVMTPHVGSASPETSAEIGRRALQNIRLAIAGRFDEMDIVNPDVL
jgi:phosphoglycerate dehydrogenase-like enzyme